MSYKFLSIIILFLGLSSSLIAQNDSLLMKAYYSSKTKVINKLTRKIDWSCAKSSLLSPKFMEKDTLLSSTPKYIEVKRKNKIIRFSFISDTISKYRYYGISDNKKKMKNAVYMEFYFLNNSLIKVAKYLIHKKAKHHEAFQYYFNDNKLISRRFPIGGNLYMSDGSWCLLVAEELMNEIKKMKKNKFL